MQAKPSWKEIAAANKAAAKGRSAEKRGDFQAALEAYEESGGHYDTSANRRRLARAKAGLGRLLEAKAELEHVLSDESASKGQKKSAQKELDELVARIPKISFVVAPDFAGELQLDGQAVPLPAEAREVDPGKHTVRASADGFRDVEFELDVKEGETKTATVELEALPKPSVSPPEEEPPETSTSLARPLGYVSLGVGIVGVALGGYFGLQAKSTRDDLGDACAQDRCPADLRQAAGAVLDHWVRSGRRWVGHGGGAVDDRTERDRAGSGSGRHWSRLDLGLREVLMTSRHGIYSALGALLALGCSNLLDYDSLEFEQGTGGTSSGGVGQGGSNGGSTNGGTDASGGSANGGASIGGSGFGAAGGSSNTGGAANGGAAAGGSGGSAGASGGSANGGSSTNGGSANGGSANGGSSTNGGSSGQGQGGTGPLGSCQGVSCGSTEYCDPADSQCNCLPGWTASGSGCTANLPGDPAGHSQQAVCDMWNWGHQIDDANPWTSGGNQCDPGTTSREGLNDTVRRLNAFRWLIGLGPSADSDAANETGRWCAVLASWNPPGTVPDPHNPPTSATCYTDAGKAGTSSSNLAWGPNHPANAIDQFVRDNGVASLGHRRWIFNPPLGPVGIGYYAGGGQYGDAQCLGVFASSGGGPSPDWVSWPPAGYAPASVFAWTWSFHHKNSLSGASVTVTRDSDGMNMPVTVTPLTGGYGSLKAIAITKSWSATVGDSYTVTVSGFTGGPVTYQVTPINC